MLAPHDVALGVEEGLEALVPLGVALGMEEVHDQLALVELEVEVELDELVEELEGLDGAHVVGSSSLGFLLEGLPLDCAVCDCGWRWLDLILEGHIRSEERRVGKECRSRWSPYH